LNPYKPLQEKLQLDADLPYTEHWSAAADFLTLLAEYCLQKKPATVLECSSGLSTLVLARCCQLNQYGKVTSLENGAEFVSDTQARLQQLKLNDYASVVHTPLEKYQLAETSFDWYSLKDMPDIRIDLLVIDGPPGFIQHHSRYPALPLLQQQLGSNCTIFLDDAARDEEKEIIALWLEKYPGLKHRYIDTERGCSILQFESV